jgi:hypothetical protein
MRAIVHREMQVAARRKATYTFRSVAAAIGVILAGFFFVLQDELKATGSLLFWLLAVSGCFFSVREGFHRAALSLSEERANGTLGLLFLTPLKGFDVVFGKFTSVSLQAFQMAAVTVPLLALTLLVGGVSLAEITRASLCLLNLTFCFIALSLFISSLTASEVAAIIISLFAIIAVITAGFFYKWPPLEGASFFNPVRPWFEISDMRYFGNKMIFWSSLLISHATGWLILVCSGLLLQRTWPRLAVFPWMAFLWTRRRKIRKGRRSVRPIGNMAPLEWLLVRNIYPLAPLFFTLTCIGVSYYCWRIINDQEGASIIALLTLALLTTSITVHSAVAVSQARKSGLLELVAVAPMSNIRMVETQVAGLRRAFLIPILLSVGWLAFFGEWRGIWSAVRELNWPRLMTPYRLASYLLMTWTVVYMGIWMGLKEKGPARAVFRTAFLTLFFPWILPIPNALYWFILGNVARQTVRTEFRELVLNRTRKPPPFPKIQ